MYTMFMKCIYCDHYYTYLLADEQRKCGKCKRKFSPKKVARRVKLFDLFKQGYHAQECVKRTGMHAATVQKYFDTFRREIALQSDEAYQNNTDEITGYDEYLYLPKSLDAKKHITKLKHFLTLSYDNQVYNLMMPPINRLGFDTNDADEHKLLEKYLKYHKISKLSKERSAIRDFWAFFETFILKYKGVSDERFIFYLKEAEWRFNYKYHL